MRIMIAGGGTAGHINPGIAIAKKIKKEHPNADILFIGTQRGLEQHLVPKEGFHIELITVRGFQRKLSMDTFKTIRDLFQGLSEARKIIKDFKPDLVIGTGGYVCGPVVFQAALMGIATMIHEQNAYPSVTNRILARFVKKIAISFEESKSFFSNQNKIVMTGNPIRPEILQTNKEKSIKNLGFTNEYPILLVFGGSQGAAKINEVMIEMLERINKKGDLQVLFAPGPKNYDEVIEQIKKREVTLTEKIKVVPYIYNMNEALAAADIAVVRAGAITIAEVTALGIPSIMIPLPTATNNHQFHNAKALEIKNACRVIEQRTLTSALLYDTIYKLIHNPKQLDEMGICSKLFGITDADEKIYSIVKEILNI